MRLEFWYGRPPERLAVVNGSTSCVCCAWTRPCLPAKGISQHENYDLFECCCCSVARSCPTLCDPMDCVAHQASLPRHYLPEFAQTRVH